VTQTDADRVHISGVATDDESVRDVYISVYNPSRNLFGSQEKVFYQAAADPKARKLEFAADIPLTPGNNIIEIRVRESDDIAATKQMWVLRTSGLKEARAAGAKFQSNGKLSVDTFSNDK
jgi:carboxyl-terminal processing protease